MNTATVDAVQARCLADLPSAPGLPLLGNIHQLDTRRLHRVLEDWQRKLGPMFTVHIGRQPVLVCSDTGLMQQVLRDRPQRWRRVRAIESVLKEMGGNGVFSVEGERWLPQRKLVMKSLASTHFRAFFPTLQQITDRLRRRWQRASAEGRVIEMREELIRFTVDATTALAFGEDPNTLEHDGNVIQDHLALIFPMIMARINAPFAYWRWIKLPRDRALDRALVAVHAHIRGLIARTRERMAANPGAAPENLLQSLLAERDAPGSTLSDDDVQANVLTLLLAGEDTTAISLAWCMPYLAADPALQDRLHERAAALFAAEPICTEHDQLRELDAFEALVTESMRHKPTVPILLLQALEDTTLGGVSVPRRTQLWLLLRPDMLDDAHFADAAEFRPERWAPENTHAAARGCPHAAVGGDGNGAPAHDVRAHLQFGTGARVCPGRHLAAVEMRLVLSMLLRNFRVELACDPSQIQEVLAFTMMPDRMPVRLHAR